MIIGLGALISRKLALKPYGFVRDERGATVIEFALLALPFFSLIGAILETSIIFLSGQVLDAAVQDTSRLIRTGQVQNVKSSAQFKSMVCDRVYGLFGDCSGIHVEVKTALVFKGIDTKPPVDLTCKKDCGWTRDERYTTGTGSEIVLVQVYYKWPVMLSLGGLTLADLPENKRLLGAAAVFRNEPYV